MFVTDMIHERHGEYVRNVSKYFAERCLGGYDAVGRNKYSDDSRDFDSIVHDLHHGYDGSMSLTEFVQRFVGPNAKVTQDNVLAAIRAAFTQLYESGHTIIDGLDFDRQVMFDMLIACHPKFDEKFGSYLPDTYELGKDEHGSWIVTVSGAKEVIMYSDGEYFLVESEDVVDDVSWVKAARNAVRMFKGCSAYDAGFAGKPALRAVRNDAIDALRTAVDDQISQHRRKHKAEHSGKYIDVVDGKVLSPRDSHVDHYPISFMRLVDTWLAQQQCGFEDIAVNSTVGDFKGAVMSNDTQRRSWQEYHREHAKLRIVSKERNISSRHY